MLSIATPIIILELFSEYSAVIVLVLLLSFKNVVYLFSVHQVTNQYLSYFYLFELIFLIFFV